MSRDYIFTICSRQQWKGLFPQPGRPIGARCSSSPSWRANNRGQMPDLVAGRFVKNLRTLFAGASVHPAAGVSR